MANLEKVESVVGGLRQVIQDLVAPEMREIKAILQGMSARMDRMDARMDKLDARMDKLDDTIARGFEDVRRQLDTYKDVQLLKERMIRVEAERSFPAAESSSGASERPVHGPA